MNTQIVNTQNTIALRLIARTTRVEMIKMNSYQVGVFDPSVASALVRGVLEVLVAELVLADEFALA